MVRSAAVPRVSNHEATDGATPLLRLAPVRPDRAGDAVERAFDEFGDQHAAVIDRARHGHPALCHHLETDAAIIELVADEDDEAVSGLLRIRQRVVEQRTPHAAASERRLDRQRPQQQRRRIADADRQLPDRADQKRANPRGEGKVEQVIDMLADAIGAQHEAAGAEGTLVQALDRVGVVRLFGQDGQGKITHGIAFSSEVDTGSRQETASNKVPWGIASAGGGVHRLAAQRLPAGGWFRYASSFISRRPRVTVSSTRPDEIESTATIMRPV